MTWTKYQQDPEDIVFIRPEKKEIDTSLRGRYNFILNQDIVYVPFGKGCLAAK